VQWDQRGAGKSFGENTPVETMNVAQFISDAHALVEILRKRFNKEKIYLAGLSWGSYLGILLAKRYPQLFSAYVGMGQIVDVQKAREITGTYLRAHAHEVGNQEALRDLEAKGRNAHETWLFAFGNELYDKTSWLPLLAAGLFSPQYTLHDVMNVAKGPQFSGKHMKYNAIKGEIMDEVTEFALPVCFFTGRYDYVTPTELVWAYCEKLRAPRKQIVWFEHSAHFPFFEEPKKFTAKMLRVLEETRPPVH
jgi:pimeloyl-ACP methyl ester carboxylesterase